MNTKYCPKCKQDLPREAFRAYTKRRDGLYANCKACEKAYRDARACTVEVSEKYCSRCDRILPASHFAKSRHCADGLCSCCRSCEKARVKPWRDAHPDYNHEHYARNPEHHRQRTVAYREAHPEALGRWQAVKLERYRADPVYRARIRSYKKANPEQQKKWNKIHYDRHRDKRIADATKWNRENRERRRLATQRHFAKFRDRYRAYHQRRRAIERGARIEERIDYKAIWERDGGICHICGGQVERADCHFDHVIPLSKGGPHTYDNIKVSHSLCNLQKGAKLL